MNEEVKAVEMPDAKLFDARRCASAAMQEMSGDFRDDDNRALIRDVAVLAAHYALARTPASCSPDVALLVRDLRQQAAENQMFSSAIVDGRANLFWKAADALESMMREKDAMGWQPIETAPEEAAVLVAFSPDDTGGGTTNPGQCVAYMDAYYQPGGHGHYEGCSGWVIADCGETTDLHYSGGGMPTHWRPLPAPPRAALDMTLDKGR